MIGTAAPRRSETRPISDVVPGLERRGAEPDRADRARAEAEIDRRSGTSTASVPKSSAGRTTSQKPASSPAGRGSAAKSEESGWGSSGAAAGVAAAHAASPSDATPTALNVQPVPASDATPPSTGPKSVPPTAAANAEPMSVPRRPSGAAATATQGHRSTRRRSRSPGRNVPRRAPRRDPRARTRRRHRDRAEPHDDRRFHPEPRGDDAARNRADQDAGRVGRSEGSRASLAELELWV